MHVDGRRLAQKPVDGIQIKKLSYSFDGRSPKNHLRYVLFSHKLGGGLGHALALEPDRLGAKTFGKLKVRFERFLVDLAILLEIDVNGKELRVEPPRQARRTGEEILGPGIGADTDGDPLANGPVLLNVFFVKIGRQCAVNLLGDPGGAPVPGGQLSFRGGRNSRGPVRLSPCGICRRGACDSGGLLG